MLGQFGYLYVYFVYASWLPGYLVLQRKMSIMSSGFVAMLPFLVGVAATISGGYISDWMVRRGARVTVARKVLSCGGLCAATIFTLLGAYTASMWPAITYLTLAIAGFSLATGSIQTMMVDIAKEKIGDAGNVMASLSGVTIEEWEQMCKMVNETKADWVEINVSCPFSADMGVKMGAGDVDRAPLIVKHCAAILKKPFSVKISPQASDPVAIAEAVEKAGGQAVNMSARFSGFMIDIETASPIGPGAQGGWGGPYLLGYGLKIVSQAAKRVKIPIIAGLGVWEWQDIIRYIMCGATLVQSGVGLMLQGYNISRKWTEQMDTWMDGKGYNSLDEIRGMALPNILRTKDVVRVPEGVHAIVDFNKCDRCGVCVRGCFYDAITLTKVGAVIDKTKCDGCGMCKEVCPENAVSMNFPRARAAQA